MQDRRKIKMDGREVFRFAVKSVPECIRELLEREQLLAEDIDYFVLHQANRRIVEAVATFERTAGAIPNEFRRIRKYFFGEYTDPAP